MKKVLSTILFPAVFGAVSMLRAADSTPALAPQPQWIWTGENALPGQTAFFRKTFSVKRFESAFLYATCDNEMEVFINGKRILQSTDWSTPVFKDVTAEIQDGANLIAVRARNEGGAAGLLVRLEIEDQRKRGGDAETVITDPSWKVTTETRKGWFESDFKETADWIAAKSAGNLGDAPWEKVTEGLLRSVADLREPQATPVEQIFARDGFRVELLYSVPKDEQGSWVSMCVDDKGRFIVCDQYGSLYRFPKPGPGDVLHRDQVEKIDVDLGHAQGLLYAFDSLYVVVNSNDRPKGLFRVRDTDGDDQFDSVETLREFPGQAGEHGPHAVLLGPGKKSIYVVVGNQTDLTEYRRSLVPPFWGEDLLLPRIYGRGFMKGVLAPRGWIARVDPDGENWDIIATGFRNEYDAAFNADGELFAYDADMEWDMNAPWYRPTRVCHTPSGAEFGWRNGSGKWPAYYPDSLPASVDIGPGSPTGVCFGYGAKFPAKYQNAMFICDWSYGKLYAVHLEPRGASYTGTFEEFVSAQPLPLTDLVVHPGDGALYFAIGGRRVQSGLYRVTYVGDDDTSPAVAPDEEGKAARELRRRLESFHGVQDERAVENAWPHLSSVDRFIRYAARTAIEHQPVDTWMERALEEKDPVAAMEALTALSRASQPDIKRYDRVHNALNNIDYGALSKPERLAFLRARGLALIRLKPENTPLASAQLDDINHQLAGHFPARTAEENIELLQLLVRNENPGVVAKAVALLKTAPSQEEQIAIAKALSNAEDGWTPELRREYFQWFVRAQTYRGGNSLALFVQSIKDDALDRLDPAEKEALKEIIEARPETSGPQFTFEPRAFVRDWTVYDLASAVESGLENRNYDNGRNLFGATTCFACHRFNQEGGAIGPDLSGVAGKFNPRDLLDSIINPSTVISDQYGSVVITTNDGRTVTGRIVNLSGDSVRVMTDMLDPSLIEGVDRKTIKETAENPVSMMPPGLLNTLQENDVLDLMAYLLSRGDPDNAMFKP